MESPWVILGRVLRVGFVPGDVQADAPAEEHVTVDAEEVEAQAEEHAAAVDAEEEEAQAEHSAAEPDFSFAVALPPRVTVLATGRGAHLDPEYPDKYPYIIAAGPLSILAHFAGAPFHGTYFADFPHESHLVLVRYFHAADGLTTASAVRIPGRTGTVPVLWNIGNVGLYSSLDGAYKIVELSVHKGSESASLVSFQSSSAHHGCAAEWCVKDVEYPMAGEDREWVPHGAVTLHSTIWWFDLSWGILSSDVCETPPDLIFHHIPDGRELAEAAPDIHAKRCVTVSRSKLRYVEIIGDGEEARVSMWTRMIGPDGWNWYIKYSMSFRNIWNDESYKETGLPRSVPLLAVVCPSNPALVYFALKQRLFGVNVPAHRVMHCEAYEIVNIPGPPQPASGRYIMAWDLPPMVAYAHGMDPFACFHTGQLAAAEEEAQEALADDEELQAGEIEDEEQPVADIAGEDQPAEEIDYADPQAAVVIGELQQAAQIKHDEQPAEVTNDNELLAHEFSDEQMHRIDMNVSVKMDRATLSRLKAEVKEFVHDMVDHPGPSQDPGDDAGEGTI